MQRKIHIRIPLEHAEALRWLAWHKGVTLSEIVHGATVAGLASVGKRLPGPGEVPTDPEMLPPRDPTAEKRAQTAEEKRLEVNRARARRYRQRQREGLAASQDRDDQPPVPPVRNPGPDAPSWG